MSLVLWNCQACCVAPQVPAKQCSSITLQLLLVLGDFHFLQPPFTAGRILPAHPGPVKVIIGFDRQSADVPLSLTSARQTNSPLAPVYDALHSGKVPLWITQRLFGFQGFSHDGAKSAVTSVLQYIIIRNLHRLSRGTHIFFMVFT